MARAGCGWGVMLSLLILFGHWATAEAKEPEGRKGIPPELVADYIHAVVEADRVFYTLQIVERMEQKGPSPAAEDWRVTNKLPLPVQFLKETSELATLTGTPIRYRLIGLSPINQQNAPADDFERAGLQEVSRDPDRPATRYGTRDGKEYFQALYADRAVSQSCASCHNSHPKSPKHDFKLDDVMGAIVITIPLQP